MLESAFKTNLSKELRSMFPGCMLLKNDANYLQGVPDMLVLWGPHWAMLETKAAPKSKRQPNQEHYVERLDRMSFSAFICPDNKEEVLDALQSAFGTRR